ncbi:MAG: NUDIX hydrolase [Actinomycetota bacterium]|nr:NUDIX hydrolase [Actinomycetota bacterium]
MSNESTSGWFETVGSEVLYEGNTARARVDRVRMPDGEIAEREVVEQYDAVGIVPILDDGTVVLLRQYRQPFQAYMLEIPAGKLDVEGEAIEEAAQRELREETGLRAGRLERLGAFRNSAGWTDEVTHLYLAKQLVPDQAENFQPKAEEADMEIVRLPFDDAVKEARAGTIVDAKTLIGLLLAVDRRA